MFKTIHKLTVLSLILCLAMAFPGGAQPPITAVEPEAPAVSAANLTLTILHTNDFHARVDEYNRDGSWCTSTAAAQGLCIGGSARLATAINGIRTGNPNVLLLDAGDQFQGTLYYNLFKADIITVTMNALGYDAMAIGNHEFDNGPAELARLIDGAGFPVLSANIDVSAEPALAGKIAPSTVVTRSGERIGIVGLTTPEAANISSPGPNVVFKDPATSLQAAVNDLVAQGVDKIIALTHMGYAEDLALAQVITGVDVIVGGHSHTFIYTPTNPVTFTPPLYPQYSPLVPAGPYPTVVNAADGKPVLIATAFQWGTFLGRLDVEFDDDGVVTGYNGNPIYISNAIVKDSTVESIITPTYKTQVIELMNTVVGTTTVDLPLTVGGYRICRVGECLLGDLVADAMLWRINSIDPENQYQIAVQNGGGLRAGINAGPVSVGAILEVLPFGNTLATFEITGTMLLQALENGVSRYPAYDGRFPQVAGMRYTFSADKPAGSRILAVEVLSGTRYVPLDPNGVYKVVTNDFMRKGGDGYTVFRDYAINPYDFGPSLAQALEDYIRTFSPVDAGDISTGRIFMSDVAINKTVTTPGGVAEVPLGSVVTYTIVLRNNGTAPAAGVVMADVLPAGAVFRSWVEQGSAQMPAGNTITWGPWDIAPGAAYTFTFTVDVPPGTLAPAAQVVNTAEFRDASGGSGSASATFMVEKYRIYLPLVMRNYSS